MFEPYLRRWHLAPADEPIVTRTSRLLPVTQGGEPAMLKIAVAPGERRGNAVMTWWDGRGAAKVLAHDNGALLLQRAHDDAPSLTALSIGGADDEACRIICSVAEQLHAPRNAPPPEAVPLERWFDALFQAVGTHGSLFARAATVASELLQSPRKSSVLHGDLHHGNILNFGPQGWLAIDPKGLVGESSFDYTPLFWNPDLADSQCRIAVRQDTFDRRIEIVARASKIDTRRLLSWVLAASGLSAAWLVADEVSPDTTLTIAAMAAAALDAG
jgi:streptomycin 6-kinase